MCGCEVIKNLSCGLSAPEIKAELLFHKTCLTFTSCRGGRRDDHAPEGSVSESAVSRNTRSSERRNIPEAGRPEEPGRCKLPLARSLQLRSVRRQHRNSFEMPHFRFLIRADSVQVFFFCLVFIKLLPYAKRKERCLCEDQRRRTAKFAPCGEDNIPAGLCTANKQNRT